MTAQELVVAMIDSLDSLGIPYMLVGSFSTNFYGTPRSTHDADFVVQLAETSVRALAERVGPTFRLDPQMTFESVTVTRRFRFYSPDCLFSVELFLLGDDPHDQERFRRRCRVSLGDRWAYVPSVEDVIITKLRWANHLQRRKDLDDARDVILVQGDRIDWDYVARWCDAHGTRELLESIRQSIPKP